MRARGLNAFSCLEQLARECARHGRHTETGTPCCTVEVTEPFQVPGAMTGRQAGGRQNQQHCEDCLVKQASFGYGDRKQRQWCSGCAKQHPGAIDKSYRLCMDCQERRAHFGPADGPKNRWCGECAGLHLGAVKARRAKAMCQTCQQKQARIKQTLSLKYCRHSAAPSWLSGLTRHLSSPFPVPAHPHAASAHCSCPQCPSAPPFRPHFGHVPSSAASTAAL